MLVAAVLRRLRRVRLPGCQQAWHLVTEEWRVLDGVVLVHFWRRGWRDGGEELGPGRRWR